MSNTRKNIARTTVAKASKKTETSPKMSRSEFAASDQDRSPVIQQSGAKSNDEVHDSDSDEDALLKPQDTTVQYKCWITGLAILSFILLAMVIIQESMLHDYRKFTAHSMEGHMQWNTKLCFKMRHFGVENTSSMWFCPTDPEEQSEDVQELCIGVKTFQMGESKATWRSFCPAGLPPDLYD